MSVASPPLVLSFISFSNVRPSSLIQSVPVRCCLRNLNCRKFDYTRGFQSDCTDQRRPVTTNCTTTVTGRRVAPLGSLRTMSRVRFQVGHYMYLFKKLYPGHTFLGYMDLQHIIHTLSVVSVTTWATLLE